MNTHWRRKLLADVLDVVLALLQLQVAALGEPAGVLQPRVVVALPVAKTSIAKEALHVVALAWKTTRNTGRL